MYNIYRKLTDFINIHDIQHNIVWWKQKTWEQNSLFYSDYTLLLQL